MKDEEPLFEADQIANGMGNIRSTFTNFPSCMIPVRSVDTNGGPRNKKQVHPLSGDIVKTFTSISSITNDFRYGRKAIMDVIECNYTWKGYKWKRQ